MEKKNTNKKIILGLIALVAVITVMLIGYNLLKPESIKGAKTVNITVVNQAGDKTNYEVHTDAEYLKGAMDDAEDLTYTGTEGEYGLMVETVNDEKAVYEDGAYWAFYVNDTFCEYGIAEQPVADGDTFKIEYTAAE